LGYDSHIATSSSANLLRRLRFFASSLLEYIITHHNSLSILFFEKFQLFFAGKAALVIVKIPASNAFGETYI
jgi:hypothetical protein